MPHNRKHEQKTQDDYQLENGHSPLCKHDKSISQIKSSWEVNFFKLFVSSTLIQEIWLAKIQTIQSTYVLAWAALLWKLLDFNSWRSVEHSISLQLSLAYMLSNAHTSELECRCHKVCHTAIDWDEVKLVEENRRIPLECSVLHPGYSELFQVPALLLQRNSLLP